MDIARTNLSLATDSFRKLTYPYTYSTFAFDVPTALGYIGDAELQVGKARQGLQPGLPTDQYAQALTQLQQALDNLANARQRLNQQYPAIDGGRAKNAGDGPFPGLARADAGGKFVPAQRPADEEGGGVRSEGGK